MARHVTTAAAHDDRRAWKLEQTAWYVDMTSEGAGDLSRAIYRSPYPEGFCYIYQALARVWEMDERHVTSRRQLHGGRQVWKWEHTAWYADMAVGGHG